MLYVMFLAHLGRLPAPVEFHFGGALVVALRPADWTIPHGDRPDEKYGPIVERVLTATCALIEQFHLIPFVLPPRRLTSIRVQGRGMGVPVRQTSHWARVDCAPE
jgi:hypothetical protein